MEIDFGPEAAQALFNVLGRWLADGLLTRR